MDFAELMHEMAGDEHLSPMAAELVPAQKWTLEAVKPNFTKYLVQVSKMLADANLIVVKDDETLKVAVSIGGEAKKISKALEAERKKTTAEAEDFVKSVRGFINSFTDDLDKAETITKKKVADYQYQKELERRKAEEAARKAQQELQDRLNREAEEANRKAREEAVKKAEEEAKARAASAAEIEAAKKAAEVEAAKHTVEAPIVPDLVMQKDEKAVHTETGTSAHIRKQWKGEVVDACLVPIGYCSPDQKKINEAVKGGVRTIPGVRIYEDASTVFRT